MKIIVMNTAKQTVLPLLIFSFFLLSNYASAKNVVAPETIVNDICFQPRDSFDDLLAYVDNDIGVNNLISNSTIQKEVRQTTKPEVITLLDTIGFFGLLQQNFFLRTNNLKTRSLLDYPEFTPFSQREKRAVYVDLFYNQTSRLFFDRNSSNICSYLAVSQPGFISAIENIIENSMPLLPEGVTIDADAILRLLSLFQTFTVQERRLGLMLGGQFSWNRWHFNIYAPWYYLERNHFVDQNIQNNIEDLVADIIEDTTGKSQLTSEEMALAEKRKNEFIDNHLICDKFGIGDTRIYADYPIIKKHKMWTRVGFLATIPTAFAFKKGLRGTSLSRAINRPTLDLVALVEGVTAPVKSVSQQAFDFGLAALDNLGAMILEAPLGNGGHFGIGLFGRNRSPLSNFIKFDWARRIVMRSFISLEYQFAATEWRSFRVPVNEALFNARNLTETDDPLIVNSNFDFIVAQLTDRLFPIALQTRVNPGVIFRWTSHMCYEGDTCGFTLGTDTYVRNKEKFSSIDTNPAVKRIIDEANARSPFAYQAKMVGSVFFKVEKPDKLFTISLIGDYTYMNKGIGSDFTLALNVDCAF